MNFKMKRDKELNTPILTEELLQKLLDHPDIEDYLGQNDFENHEFSSLLKRYTSSAGLECKDIIHATNINATHCYQMYSGERGGSRNKILQIALVLKLSYKDCNRLLNSAGVSALYCKNRRDAIIIFCLKNHYNVDHTNDTLFKLKEDTLDN